MADYSKSYNRPPELLHFFQEKNKLLGERKYWAPRTNRLKKRRKRLFIFCLFFLFLGQLHYYLFSPLILFAPLAWLAHSSFLKSDKILTDINSALDELGIDYKKAYVEMHRKRASNCHGDDYIASSDMHRRNNSTQTNAPNCDETCKNDNCENDCDHRDFSSGYDDDFDADSFDSGYDFDDYGGWDSADNSSDYSGDCDGGFDFGGDDGCDGGCDDCGGDD